MGSFVLRKEDVVESFVRSSGPGGQNVNKVATCVELRHRPTGVRIKCQTYRTQAQNRQEAWRLLQEAIKKKFEQQYRELKAHREKIRRQNRKRSKAAKEIILEQKRKQAFKKVNRRKALHEE